MLTLFKHESDIITIKCPMCSSSRAVKISDIKENKKRRSVSFRCSCGTHFHKRIIRKNLREIDLIAAIARFDLETLWYKIKQIFFFLGGPNDPEKIRLA
ncbi:MAG: hypothetical protein KKE62_04885 [Proteobacteria bacterium]|nr:hypothetical protein [Pseudomonadota bacterium]MBU1388098.1 hypothetical protein [Pseudomonadota bacterium]MBU1542162.1 hypothetical protein [Pseudomonadota bacterium]MBU2481682.1 hypothetical protein [Pseudomonadota bacterium]